MVGKIIGIVFLVLIIVAAGYCAVEIYQDNPERIAAQVIKSYTLGGDHLMFKAKYLSVLPGGTVTLSNKGIEQQGKKRIVHLSAQAQTFPFIASIFEVKAQFDSYVDVDKAHTLKFTQHLEIINKPDEDKEIISC